MRKKIANYISTWKKRCYTDGIPDEGPHEIFDKVPSYKRIAITILKNDYALKTLGVVQKKSMLYNELKRLEFEQRKTKPKQLTLFS
jgi:predicted phosphoadenosine phosphosulfate sulfurtransferase